MIERLTKEQKYVGTSAKDRLRLSADANPRWEHECYEVCCVGGSGYWRYIEDLKEVAHRALQEAVA